MEIELRVVFRGGTKGKGGKLAALSQQFSSDFHLPSTSLPIPPGGVYDHHGIPCKLPSSTAFASTPCRRKTGEEASGCTRPSSIPCEPPPLADYWGDSDTIVFTNPHRTTGCYNPYPVIDIYFFLPIFLHLSEGTCSSIANLGKYRCMCPETRLRHCSTSMCIRWDSLGLIRDRLFCWRPFRSQ
jgi:hypothetical protein